MSKVSADLIGSGKLFHSSGAATEKERSPLVFNLDLGTSRKKASADLRALVGLCTCIRSVKYAGANPFKILKTNIRILKSIRKRTGSQWREARTGDMCSRFFCAC